MDYKHRLHEQRRNQRLGCLILATSILTGMVAAWFICFLSAMGGFILLGNQLAFYVLGVLFAGAIYSVLKDATGFRERKASLQNLKPNSPFETNPDTDADETTKGYSGVRVLGEPGDPPSVSSVVGGSPADLAGIRPGDIITQINESYIANVAEFRSGKHNCKPQESITMHVRRDDQSLVVQMTLLSKQEMAELL
jgi:membrane-associated protease RseP (regulator of RpoE activity)